MTILVFTGWGVYMSKFNLKLAFIQKCWILVAALLLTGFIYESLHNHDNIFTLARPLGLIMFLAGFINLIACYKSNDKIHGSSWLIADGLTALLLSFFLLFNQMIYPVMIPFFFGFWELFSGILKVMDSHHLHSEKIKCWIGFAVIGYTELISGTVSMIKPIDEAVGFNNLIGLIFLIQCVSFILKVAMYKNIKIAK